MAIFRKLAEFINRVNKSGNSPYLSFLWFSLKNDNFGLKMKISKFLGNPTYWKCFIISDKDLQDQPGMSLPVLGIMLTTLNMLDIWRSVIGGGRPVNLKASSIKILVNGMRRLNSGKFQNFKAKLSFPRLIHSKWFSGFVKNPEIQPSYRFRDFPSKIPILKIKILKSPGI